ncbi:hypothetical protein ACFWA4_04945 [Streptomyces sp. NPDC060011]|uniref:hypothetical protein n=1 Tax=unclassified Streptomyces TaxID=2593676 RepID=UPI003679BBE2
MAIPRARKALMLGASSAVAAILAAVALTSGTPASAQPVTAGSATDMRSAVETFDYPGADRVYQDRKITLKRGDGHITLVDCDDAWNIKIESRLDNGGYCFRATAKTGSLTLELPDAYGVWTEDHPVKATLTADGKETVVSVPTDDYQPVGEAGDTGLRSVLVELRVTG